MNSFPSIGLITHGDIDEPKSKFILSSATAFTASIKYFGLKPISKFFPTLSTNNSSLTSFMSSTETPMGKFDIPVGISYKYSYYFVEDGIKTEFKDNVGFV